MLPNRMRNIHTYIQTNLVHIPSPTNPIKVNLIEVLEGKVGSESYDSNEYWCECWINKCCDGWSYKQYSCFCKLLYNNSNSCVVQLHNSISKITQHIQKHQFKLFQKDEYKHILLLEIRQAFRHAVHSFCCSCNGLSPFINAKVQHLYKS